ncbi:hypothetical protein GLOIN_2v1481003 [Rhizophagus clarus]|uniref:Uncharacterized protein n=1 Tax=Rhizophagus clarus TaxID=94130 RepID=A0A8H3M7G4_9GLOM|nr:hypothetical protein GLOIN_2v1481003 [Rhizophagus clarus]
MIYNRKDRRKEKPEPIQTPILKDKNQENDPKTGPSLSTQANREEQAGPSKVTQGKIIDRHTRKPKEHMKTWGAKLRRRWFEVTGKELDLPLNLKECQRLHHDLLQADNEAFKENIPQEMGPSEEDIIFKECPVGRDPERPHRNPKPEEYKKLPYIPQLIGLIRPKIKEVLQTELRKKDQIKSAIVALCQYSITKKNPDDISEPVEVEKYHRENMRPIFLEGDIEEHITKTIGEIDVQIEETLKKESGYILKRILEISIETYILCRALGGSYIPTPKKLANTKSTINPNNQGLINPKMNRPSERCL